ncbi:MAG: hypothetical protein NTX05_09035 [Fusobacteria bacterium]|nr:hypothetical protein [Fusobacteriota bacterium]
MSLSGWISDILIKNGFAPIKARELPASIGSLISGIAIIPVNYIHSTSISMVLITIIFFFSVMRVGVLWALATSIVHSQVAETLGEIQDFFNFLGGTLAPIATEYILPVTQNNYNSVIIICVIMALISAVSYGFIRNPIIISN